MGEVPRQVRAELSEKLGREIAGLSWDCFENPEYNERDGLAVNSSTGKVPAFYVTKPVRRPFSEHHVEQLFTELQSYADIHTKNAGGRPVYPVLSLDYLIKSVNKKSPSS